MVNFGPLQIPLLTENVKNVKNVPSIFDNVKNSGKFLLFSLFSSRFRNVLRFYLRRGPLRTGQYSETYHFEVSSNLQCSKISVFPVIFKIPFYLDITFTQMQSN